MTEKQLHIGICKYIKIQYKNIYFLSDPSGLKMSIGMATQLKKTRSSHAQLDIVILEPNLKYKGLVLEVKKSKSDVFKKNGEYKGDKHFKDQLESRQHLIDKGYHVDFVYSVIGAIDILIRYMDNKI